MPKSADPERQLAGFIARYTPDIADLAEAVLNKMRRRYSTALELVYDNYNALAIGFGPTERASDAIFSIALYPQWVSLFFLQAKGLCDPSGMLKGSGKVCKHVVLPSPAMLDDPALAALMKDAVASARVPFDPKGMYRLIIKSISKKQRPRRPAVKSQTSKRAAPAKRPVQRQIKSA
jgi:hypothetical protein